MFRLKLATLALLLCLPFNVVMGDDYKSSLPECKSLCIPFISPCKQCFGTAKIPSAQWQYVGEFGSNGKYHGWGTNTFGSRGIYSYKGFWSNGRRHGYGSLSQTSFLDSSPPKYMYGWQPTNLIPSVGKKVLLQYEGYFENDFFHGSGKSTVKNEHGTLEIYDGNWEKGARSGRGKLEIKYSTGSRHIYHGLWDANVFIRGTLSAENNNKTFQYHGGYANGKRNGTGVLKTIEGTYEGVFKNDKFKNGYVDITFEDGSKYEGGWNNDKKNGEGTFTDVDGQIKIGLWKDGVLLKPSIENQDNPSNDNEELPTALKPNAIVWASSGSGFAVSDRGHVITNNHVIDGCQNVYIHQHGKKVPAVVVNFDLQNDVALLKGEFKPQVSLAVSSERPTLAQDIYVAGYPFGLNISSSVKVTKGIISSLTGVGNNLAAMQIDAALQSGSSGGPILDEYGNVVGVAVAKLDVKFALENFGAIPENTNFGVKANIVEALLDANGVNYQQGKTEKPSGAEFSNMLSNGTYYISCWMTLAQIEAMKTKKVMFSDLQ